MVAAVWLVVVLAGVAIWTVNDTRQYRLFSQLADSSGRRAFYWRWTVQSFVFLTAAAAISLGLLGRVDAWAGMPVEFAPLAAALQPDTQAASGAADQRLGMMIGFSIGMLIMVVTWKRRIAKMVSPVIGDTEPLIPRNGAEMLAALPLSLNAGFAEELFFRLALPLLVTRVTGSAAVGIGVAIVVFGLIHWYQGWKGVIATTIVGAVLTLVYLKSGSILRVMVMHALIDVMALIVRPMIATRWQRSAAAAPSVSSRPV